MYDIMALLWELDHLPFSGFLLEFITDDNFLVYLLSSFSTSSFKFLASVQKTGFHWHTHICVLYFAHICRNTGYSMIFCVCAGIVPISVHLWCWLEWRPQSSKAWGCSSGQVHVCYEYACEAPGLSLAPWRWERRNKSSGWTGWARTTSSTLKSTVL